MNYSDFFDLHNIKYQEGLSDVEIIRIESLYKIQFPDELKSLFKQVFPISEGFYNWRDFSEKNVEFILQALNRPFNDFYNEASEIYWNDDWGEEPETDEEIQEIIRDKLLSAPKLIPIYAHRYISMINGNTNPIFSIHGIDIIIYGESLDDYLTVEFGEKSQSDINFSNVLDVPFWSEVM